VQAGGSKPQNVCFSDYWCYQEKKKNVYKSSWEEDEDYILRAREELC